MLRKLLGIGAVSAIAFSIAVGQVSPQGVAFAPSKVSQPLPFKAGETLSYEVSFSKLIFSGTIGELKLHVAKPREPSETAMLELTAEAVSKGFFPSLFGVKVHDRYTSMVNPSDFGLHASTKLLEQGKVRREQKAVVDREAGRVTFFDRDLTTEKSEPKVKEKPSPSWTQDLLSTIYYVRTQPLKEGDVVAIPVSDGGEVYNIEVVAGKREEVKTGLGKFKTVQLNAKVFDGRYIKRSGEMLVWVSDDETRIPLRAKVKTSGYTITAELKRLP
ncbi:MAG TPA: DUF3108 domain-containing protein [Blastocatellia bacterium]|nr:DUF3108 domain-containing protein [Blastocatellia bacterium]